MRTETCNLSYARPCLTPLDQSLGSVKGFFLMKFWDNKREGGGVESIRPYRCS